jgi:hypothetical protein
MTAEAAPILARHGGVVNRPMEALSRAVKGFP